VFIHGELHVRSMHIAEYLLGTYANHESKRVRKLLLKKTELKALEKRTNERGFTIVPYKIYFNERGLAKIKIALAQGKKTFDKRETLKERDQKRELDALKKIKLR
jgi:SsrA-binding protein